MTETKKNDKKQSADRLQGLRLTVFFGGFITAEVTGLLTTATCTKVINLPVRPVKQREYIRDHIPDDRDDTLDNGTDKDNLGKAG